MKMIVYLIIIYVSKNSARLCNVFGVCCFGLDGNLENSFKPLQLEEALIIGVETDLLFPISQQAELAEALEKYVNKVRLVRLDSLQGHDSFLVDMDRFRPVISSFI